jgi:hypothetical protein
MSMIEINWHPKHKELRNFGLIALIASVIISLLLYLLKDLGIQWILVITGAGSAIFLCSLISDVLTRIIYIILTLVTLPIGWVMSFIMLAIFYFLILTPLGLVFRLTGRDPLHRKFDSRTESYWLKRQPPDTIDRYYHQF